MSEDLHSFAVKWEFTTEANIEQLIEEIAGVLETYAGLVGCSGVPDELAGLLKLAQDGKKEVTSAIDNLSPLAQSLLNYPTPMPPLSKMTVLYAVKLPKEGGDTGFVNMQAAFSGLEEVEQSHLLSLKTVNVLEQNLSYVDDKTRQSLPPQKHPFIRTHPETGKKAIYVHPGKLAHFEGMSPSESKALLNSLLDRVLKPEITYRDKWSMGDLVIWDNRATLHVAHTDYDPNEGRILHRICLEGDVPA